MIHMILDIFVQNDMIDMFFLLLHLYIIEMTIEEGVYVSLLLLTIIYIISILCAYK